MGLVPLEKARQLAGSFYSVGHLQHGRGFSPEPDCAGTQILDLRLPELREITSLLFISHPIYSFVSLPQAKMGQMFPGNRLPYSIFAQYLMVTVLPAQAEKFKDFLT